MPIFISFDSADLWANPNLFLLNEKGYPSFVAGIPPDYFSETGQLWGNPLYNIKAHKKDNYSWWVKRIKVSLESCDILRIDHFRGFESFFAIPFGSENALNGKWVKSFSSPLFETLKKELGTINLIAEDLGTITEKVTLLRKKHNLPGMKILQFAFTLDNNNPYLPHNYDKNSVVYTGTHDNDTSIGWYNKLSEEEKDYFRRYLNSNGDSPSWDLIRLAISSSANYAVYPLQDILCLDSDGPSTAGGNWQWRYSEEMLLNSHAKNLKNLTELFQRDNTIETQSFSRKFQKPKISQDFFK